jgi:hypothetical protein
MAQRIYIVQASHVASYTIELRFNDGMVRTVDFGKFLKQNPHPQYNKYQKPENFKKFQIEQGNIVWGRGWDLIFPIEQLYSGRLQA